MELLGKGFGIEGVYNLVPPPELKGWGFKKLKRGLKKVRKVAKKTGKIAIKVHTAPIKAVAKTGKFALKAAAKLAAKPIVFMFRKLAGRRAKYLAWKSGVQKASSAQKQEAAKWAVGKVNRAGPVGKLGVRILKFVGAHRTAGVGIDELEGGWQKDASMCGLTGAEIVAASAAIVGSLKKIMGALNRPGEAPANPGEGESREEEVEDVQPIVESDDAEGGTEGASKGFREFLRRKEIKKRLAQRLKGIRKAPVPPVPRRRGAPIPPVPRRRV